MRTPTRLSQRRALTAIGLSSILLLFSIGESAAQRYDPAYSGQTECMNHVPWSIGDELTYHVIAGDFIVFEYSLTRTPIWRGTLKQPRRGDTPWRDIYIVKRTLRLPDRKRSPAAYTNLKVPPTFVDRADYVDIFPPGYEWFYTLLPADAPPDWSDLRSVREFYWQVGVFSWPLKVGHSFVQVFGEDHFVDVSVGTIDLGDPLGSIRAFLVADRYFIRGRIRSSKRWFSPSFPLTVREEFQTTAGPVEMTLVGFKPASGRVTEATASGLCR